MSESDHNNINNHVSVLPPEMQSGAVYKQQSFRPGERPEELKDFDPKKNVTILPNENGGNTVMFSSDPEYDKAHQVSVLPPEMRGDFSNTPPGLVARTTRLYENAISVNNRAVVAPEWYHNVMAGAGACAASIIATAAFKGVMNYFPMINDELKETSEHAVLFGTMTTTMHMAHEFMQPKNVHTISSDAARIQEQARNQAREAYALATLMNTNTDAANNIVPYNRVSETESPDKLQEEKKRQF